MNEIIIKNTNENFTEIIQTILQNVENDTVITFEKGTYNFFEQGTYTGIFHPSNNASGEKKVVFYISGKKNITIKGNGSKFLFRERVFPFIIENSENITFEDFNIDFSFTTFCETTVEKVYENGLELKCLQKDLELTSSSEGELLLRSGNNQYSNAIKRYFISNRNNNRGKYFETPSNKESKEGLPAPIMVAKTKVNGNNIYIECCENSQVLECSIGDKIIISFDQNRENDVFFADRVKDFCVDSVNIFRGAGMGVISQMCENVTIRNCCFAAGMHEHESFALTADDLMFVQCCGKVIIKNNIICDSLDDAINIHGTYTRIKNIISENEIEVEFCQKEQGCTGFCEAGDVLIVSDGESYSEKCAIEVASAKMISDRLANIILKKQLMNKVKIGDLLENQQRSPEVEISGNFIKSCPNLRISSAKPIKIENNTIAATWCGLVIADLMQYWYESGKVYNVIVKNNTFCDITPLGKVNGITIFHSKGEKNEGYHENISIIDNKFVLKDGTAIKAENVKNFEMRGNRVNTEKVSDLINVYFKE